MSLIELEPSALWKYFEQICRIPRLSKKEEKITEYLITFARELGLRHQSDENGNVLISKPAAPGFEKLPKVILQSHVDMVGEKLQESKHNFDRDPIEPYIEGDWVKAKGTTLGADDGIGVAAQMAILADKNIEHGPLECLFTVDEESGMTGARDLQPDFFSGKILINLDSEDEGELFIGCAGGIDTVATFEAQPKKPGKDLVFYRIMVSGLSGGHSGDEIQKSPGNAIKILDRFLWNITRVFKARVAVFEGGNLRNAIPREAYARFGVPAKKVPDFESYYQVFTETLRMELKHYEPLLSFELTQTKAQDPVLGKKTQSRLLNSIYACPHGVITWSGDLEDLVETSTNLASVKYLDGACVEVVTSQRSSVDSAKKDIADRIASLFTLAGARVEHTDGYPGWSPDTNSEILRITGTAYSKLFRKKPLVRAIHAGLECGLILEKYPDLDMISFGPTIRGAHTPEERISIRSTVKFWKLLLYVLSAIPSNGQ